MNVRDELIDQLSLRADMDKDQPVGRLFATRY
jgi:hypothetical protein